MRRNTCKYIITILSVILILTIIIPNFIYAATDLGLGDLSEYKNEASMDSAKAKAGTIIGIIKTVGTVISVIALIAIGIKYMMGSVEEKAEYKETLKPYIIGAFLLFAGSILPQIIYEFMSNF